ncbi:hypothetical protein ABPG75_004268 [Micractinium tetrahymenae]
MHACAWLAIRQACRRALPLQAPTTSAVACPLTLLLRWQPAVLPRFESRYLAASAPHLPPHIIVCSPCRLAHTAMQPDKKNDKAWPTAGNYGLRAYATYECKGADGKTVKKGFEVWPSPDVVVAKMKGKKIQKITKFPWDYMPDGGHQIITGSN